MSSPRASLRYNTEQTSFIRPFPASIPCARLTALGPLSTLIAALSALIAALSACSSPPPATNVHAIHAQDVTHPSVIEASNSDEVALLKQMWDLPEGKDKKVGALTVKAEPLYRSASGRNCRNLRLKKGSQPAEERLACTRHHPEPRDKDEVDDPKSEAWVFVPSVFMSDEAHKP